MAMFKVGQEVERIKTGEPVCVTEVMTLNRMTFYRVRLTSGSVEVVSEDRLRAFVTKAA
jgi:hypothetical protein